MAEWERLADALKRVVDTGVTEREARVSICRGISDGSITVRLLIGNIERADVFLLEGWERAVPPTRTPRDFALWESVLAGLPPRQPSLMIPSHVEPNDFEWQESRSLKPWRDPQGSFSFFDWHGDRIELCSADVARILIAPRSGVRARPKKPAEKRPAAARRTTKSSPKREQARIALKEIYHGRVPNPEKEPDSVLVKKVTNLLKEKFPKDFVVSVDTILRAARRRKDGKGRARHV